MTEILIFYKQNGRIILVYLTFCIPLHPKMFQKDSKLQISVAI